ncbi:UNKNOWN [Stylonychia lemnae]|uniref:Seipin n=1 Tax=Stylonychia lemnae TaxID=5949 RepID=A0A078AS10_STYLE|nr:UNKNOWN [Stylonychia lemnae]|eukprot:CDW85270.1 UNKNOWN [Stylonychia lemnae]
MSTFCNNQLLDQLSQINTQSTNKIVEEETNIIARIDEKYGEPMMPESDSMEEEKGLMMINTYERKQLKMKKHKRVKRRKLLRNLLKQPESLVKPQRLVPKLPKDKSKDKKQSKGTQLLSFMVTAMFFPSYVMFSTLKSAAKLPLMPALWIIKKFYPNIVDDISVKSREIKSSVKDQAGKSFMTMSSLMAKSVLLMMTLALSMMIGTFFYAFIFYVIMPHDAQIKPLSFQVSSIIDQRIDEKSNLISQPQLVALVPVGSQKSGFKNTQDVEIDLRMDDELYNIDVDFGVSESDYNMQKGNIYLNAKVSSYVKKHDTLSYHRISHISYKSGYIIWVKEMFRYVPVINIFCNCEPKQTVTVHIVENFNNAEFQAKAIEIILSNASIVFSDAVLRITPALFGIRYLMGSWFFTSSFIFITIFTSIIFVTFIAFYLVARTQIKHLLFNMYPQAKKSKSKKNQFLQKKKQYKEKDEDIDSSQQQTDIFSDFESSDQHAHTDEDHDQEEQYDPNKLMEGRCVAERIFVFLIRALVE